MEKLLSEVFTQAVWFDMTGAGGEAKELSAEQICEIWRQGFVGLDAVHHQAGHYLINVHSNNAEIYGYAWAMHFKKTAARRKSRTFVGSYDLEAADGDCHNLNHQKYIDGNVSLE